MGVASADLKLGRGQPGIAKTVHGGRKQTLSNPVALALRHDTQVLNHPCAAGTLHSLNASAESLRSARQPGRLSHEPRVGGDGPHQLYTAVQASQVGEDRRI